MPEPVFDWPTVAELDAAAEVVYRAFGPTPQQRWDLLSARLGTDCWVKHENHTPVGAFKIRGGLTFFDAVARREALPREVFCATRGNHGQSVAWAARLHGVRCTIVVPHGNSSEKNAAMRALGAHLVEHGDDFTASAGHAQELAAQAAVQSGRTADVLMVPSFHRDLVLGVATYWLEFLRAVPQLEVVYVPIGLGSGACAALVAKRALGHPVRVVGVVSRDATTYADSIAAGKVVEAPVSVRLADGVAVRRANEEALQLLAAGLDDILQVSDDEVAAAMRAFYTDTHNLAEGAGAVALAGALQQRQTLAGRSVGVVLTGANVDAAVMVEVLRAAG